MNYKEIIATVDHTLLLPNATSEQIIALCNEALEYSTASVCINPKYVALAASVLNGRVAVCTVVGFPLGANTIESKVFEAIQAIDNGADEIDMVISIGDALEGNYDRIKDEISAVKTACGERILKVIVETCLLNDTQKAKLCHIVEQAGADFIKTSTGFSTGGATFADIELFAKETEKRIKIKASGGIKSFDDMKKYIEIGADRLGTSSGVKYVKQEIEKNI